MLWLSPHHDAPPWAAHVVFLTALLFLGWLVLYTVFTVLTHSGHGEWEEAAQRLLGPARRPARRNSV